MGDTIQVKVDTRLAQVLEEVRKDAAEKIKKLFNLEEATVYGTMASQILAAHYIKKKSIHFRVRKLARGRGILELLE